MTTSKAKIAVSIDPDVLGAVRAAVSAGEAGSVSAYVEHALRSQLAAVVEFDRVIAEMLEASGGVPSKTEIAAARRLLADSSA